MVRARGLYPRYPSSSLGRRTMHKIDKNRFGEWPIVSWWYTKKKGLTIEETIDKDLDWFLWAVCAFQNVTPAQAEYFYKKTGKKLNPKLIQNVEPYEWVKGDTEEMYMEICNTQDLHGTIRKYRGEQLSMF